jgi:toxoflavin biosynthesis protein ToxD
MNLGKSHLSQEPVNPADQDLPVRMSAMITIPAGKFWMGTSETQVKFLLDKEDWASEWFNSDLFHIENPMHELNLPSYEIAQNPVTNNDYYVFIYNTGYRVPKNWIGFHCQDGQEEHPVTSVSRQDVDAYLQWLNKATGKTYRLPSEAEWEKAARGGDQRIYPWGDSFDPWRCNTIESGKRLTSPVGCYSPGGDSPYGLADMVGNVWEWTRSKMNPYPFKVEASDRLEPGEKLVVRGGAWYYSRALARVSSREGVLPDYISPALGFRLARSIG